MANNNELPCVPDFIRTLNDGEERIVAPPTFFVRVKSLGIGAQRGIVSNAVNVPIPMEKMVSQLPLTSADNVVTLNFKRKLKYDHSYLTMNVSLKNVCSALNYLINTELYKKLDITLSEGNISLLRSNITNSVIVPPCLEDMQENIGDVPSI